MGDRALKGFMLVSFRWGGKSDFRGKGGAGGDEERGTCES